MSVVEKMARALYNHDIGFDRYDEISPPNKARLVVRINAILTATGLTEAQLEGLANGTMVVVPVEPTEAMKNAAWKALGLSKREQKEATAHLNALVGTKDEALCIRAFRAMLAAKEG